MSTVAYQPIKDTGGLDLASLLTTILGRQVNTGQNTTGTTTTGTAGSTDTSQSSNTTNTADLGALQQVFQQASAGMSPAQMQALITSVFQEGARQVPALTQQYANATGSRVRGNSGLQLALGDLNRDLSTAAVNQLLQYNTAAQNTAANAASNIAANTRQTQQTQQQSQQQNQQQTQQQNQNTTGKQTQTVSPQGIGASSLLGLGGTALNWLDKKGAFNSLFGRGAAGGAAGATGTNGIGTISGGAPLGTFGGSPVDVGAGYGNLTGGGGISSFATSGPAPSAGALGYNPGTAAQSTGLYQAPAMATPGGDFGSGISAGPIGTSAIGAPTFDSSGVYGGGITGYGGYTGGNGFDIGSLGNIGGFGSLPAGFNAFGTAGTESLGSNLGGIIGSNPYGYSSTIGGGTGLFGGSAPDYYDQLAGWGTDSLTNIGSSAGDFLSGVGSQFASGIAGVGSSLADLGSSAWDWVGSFFANGGPVGVRRRLNYADGGGIGAPGDTRYGNVPAAAPMPIQSPMMGFFPRVQAQREMQAGLAPAPMMMQQGTVPRVGAETPMPSGTPVDAIMGLVNLMRYSMGYADGGVVGAPAMMSGGSYADGGSVGYGTRADGTPKGQGFYGEVPNPYGGVSTELSAGINLGGQEVLIPLMVPGMSAAMLHQLLATPQGQMPSEEIIRNAADFARTRQQAGKPFFAQPGEQGQLPPGYADGGSVQPQSQGVTYDNWRAQQIQQILQQAAMYPQTDPSSVPTVLLAQLLGLQGSAASPAGAGRGMINPPMVQPRAGFADGGSVTQAPVRTRNRNYLGSRPELERAGALNYEGYAPIATGGAGSGALGAGGSGMGALNLANVITAPGAAPVVAGSSAVQYTPLQIQQIQLAETLRQEAARQQQLAAQTEATRAAMTAQGMGGSGGVGEGGSPTSDSVSEGQAGNTGGVAPGIGTGASAIGAAIGAPLGLAISAIDAIAQAVAAANAPAGGGVSGTAGGIGSGDAAAAGTSAAGVGSGSAVGGIGDAATSGVGVGVGVGGPSSVGGVDGGTSGGDGGGGGGGGKIICTAMNDLYGLPYRENAIWIGYARKHLTPAHERGYHKVFLPLVDIGFKQGSHWWNLAVRDALIWIAKNRTQVIRDRNRGVVTNKWHHMLCNASEKLLAWIGK